MSERSVSECSVSERSVSEHSVTRVTSSHAHRSDIQTTPFLHLRYEKTDCALMCSPDLSVGGGETSSRHGDFEKAFTLR